VLTLFRERYEVLAHVGSGGEAQIVKALDRQHGRFVALKIRPVHDQAAREDMLGEARVLLTLAPHPALPLVREDFFDRDDYVVAMDWVEGTDLATLLAENGRPGLAPSSVLAYLAQAAEALTHLHSQSPPVIHGDVKPGNLILTKGGRIKLVDFGLSSATNVPRVRAGTPGYRAPELAAGAVPSRASDIYALAATAFALLTGSAPAGVLPAWDGFDTGQARQLETAIRLGMATDPARRPKTSGELVERLRAGWSAALPTGVVTFCCSDIAGASALWEAHPEAMAEALVRHDELIADAVAAGGGSLIKSMGDSTVSVFDSAPAAVGSALAANRSLTREEWPPGIRITARWGIHTGEAERRDDGYYGRTVNLAGRVAAQADGGEILLSAVTSELVAGHLPERCVLVDLGPHLLEDLTTPERIHALAGPGVRTSLSAAECPYRGLLAFESDDRAFFFGREAVVTELVGRTEPGRLLAVVGASGSGKSSVLRAGLLAAARAGEIAAIDDAVLLTPGHEPRLEVSDEPGLLVVVDQFEELFTLCDDTERRERFIDALLRLRCAVAIAMRADLYGRLSGHAELARAVAANQVLLRAMTHEELARAVTAPARLTGLRLEPGLVELILRDIAAEPGALPLLSHALRATWERRDGRTLTVDGYAQTGGVASALARTADAVVDDLPAEQQPLAHSVFLRMTELGEGSEDSRRRVTVDELVPEGAEPATVRALLGRLADARLVTLDDGAAQIAHEALIRSWPRLRHWLDEDRATIRAQHRLGDAARIWDTGGRETADLYRGARLATALELAQSGRTAFNATERAFLDAGVAERERERRAEQRVNRRLRALLAAGAVLLVFAIAGAALSLNSRSNARTAESAAQVQALTSDAERVGALALAAPTLDQSLLFALAGVEIEDSAVTRGHLVTVLQHNPAAVRQLQMSTNPVLALAATPDGRLLATGDATGVIRFTDLRSWEPSGPTVRLPLPVTVQAMSFSPDGQTLAVGTGDGRRAELHFIDVATRRARPVGSWQARAAQMLYPQMSLAFAPDGRHLAIGVATFGNLSHPFETVAQRLLLLDARTGRPAWRGRYPSRRGQWEAQVLFSRRGELITSATFGDTIVWDVGSGRIVRRYPIGGKPAISPDGHTLALALNGPNLAKPSAVLGLLDLRSGHRRELAQDLHDEMLMSVAFEGDGSRLVGAAFEGTHVWDVASGAIVERFPDEQTNAASGDVVVDRRGLALVTPGDGGVSAWDPAGANRLGRVFHWGSDEETCNATPCTVVDSSGALMAASAGDGTVAVVDLRTKRPVTRLPARNGEVAEGLAFLPGGRRLATGGIAGSVTIWDLPSETVARRLRHYAEPVRTTAVSPDGTLVAVQRQADGARDSHVEVRDLRSDETLYTDTVGFGLEWPGGLSFSRDGRMLVASGCCAGGSTVLAWDARTGERRFQLSPARKATAFAISHDSQLLAVGTEDGSVILFDARSGKQRGAPIKVAGSLIFQVAISPDARLLAIVPINGGTTLWDLRSRSRLGDEFLVSSTVVPAVAFEPNGRLLITEFGKSIEWPVDLPTLRRFACRLAGRDLTREEWADVLPTRSYRPVCAGSAPAHDGAGG
jgi:WD40 repeat protein/class 3 adenylate cyclase/tRNA A-37 threonylcarbamoyl transferase component Bud32